MHNFNLESYEKDCHRVQAIIGNDNSPDLDTPENISRGRLLRVQAGLHHLLLEVIPKITDEKQRYEVFLLVDGIHDLTRFEQCDADSECKALGENA